MAISPRNVTTISGNGASDWIKLPADGDRLLSTVTVGNPGNTWGGSTVAELEYCPDATLGDAAVPSPVKEGTTPVAFSENGNAVLENVRGFVRVVVSNYAGSDPLSLHVA